ncbi:MAG TPA: hypothetical protein VJJ23_02870 [Candidatus Nanoarchaeia archaeon]|nr:hypothetical protein [Candidatus Nanoarchaeia archaeon]
MTTGLEQFYGTYLGFSPTDSSAAGLGELEIIITESLIKGRFATGYEIISEEIPISMLKPMTKEDIKNTQKEGSSYVDRCVGFDLKGVKYIFLVDPKEDEFGLLIYDNELADILGPPALFNPKQIEMGAYKEFIEALEKENGKGCYPTLENGGKVSKDLGE